MGTRKNAVISATRWSAVSFLMALFVFLSIAGVQAQQLTYGSTIRMKIIKMKIIQMKKKL